MTMQRVLHFSLLVISLLLSRKSTTTHAQESSNTTTTDGGDGGDGGGGISLGGFTTQEELQECWANLLIADTDDDGMVFADEYVTFAKLESPPGGVPSGVTDFSDLPLEFKAAFQFTACLCRQPAFGGNATDTECCLGGNAHIRVTPYPSQDMSEEDQAYLAATCSFTRSAGDAVLGSPTASPTLAPVAAEVTEAPTLDAGVTPTLEPTSSSVETTVAPSPAVVTVVPTMVTLMPTTTTTTDAPTGQPSTAATTVEPTETAPPSDATATNEPTMEPSTGREDDVTSPTTEPSTTPPIGVETMEPTTPRDSPTVQASVVYQILVQNGTTLANSDPLFVLGYKTDLERAMNALAPAVASEVFGGGGSGGRRRRLRRLEVTVFLPTDLTQLVDIDCPAGVDSSDLCQDAPTVITLILVDENDPDGIVTSFEDAMNQAIAEGRLDEELVLVNPDTPLVILNSELAPTAAPSVSSEDSTSLDSGATAGIVIASLTLITVCVGAMFYATRRPSDHGDDNKADYVPYADDKPDDEMDKPEPPTKGDEEEPEFVVGEDHEDEAASMSETEVYTESTAAAVAATAASTAVLGAEKPDYGRDERKQTYDEDIVGEPELDHQQNAAVDSDAGSSGWSSSAGISSLNTGSMDESTDAGGALGGVMTLAAIGVAGHAVSRDDEEEEEEHEVSAIGKEEELDPAATRGQLDSLIEAGDWAAVGATAALLAAASDSQSVTSASRTSASRTSTRGSSSNPVDAARAAELDNLVDAGDWEGVVLAAARFEQQESSSRSVSSASTGLSLLTGGDQQSVQSETDASKERKRAEIREEVEMLVARVVPEELDNIDEMMNQFEGREEELVETLRTMQERSVAQKARTASQAAAKTEARQTVQRGVVPGVSTEPVPPSEEEPEVAVAAIDAATAAAVTAAVLEDEPAAASATESSGPPEKSALELAIEQGDWTTVGEAAAMMSDAGSMTSGGTGATADLELLTEMVASEGSRSRTSASTGRSTSEGESSGLPLSRTAELEGMIDKGDWSGVVLATKKYDEDDKKGRTKEEEEALAQAEAWMKIAEQAKTEGATDAGASDAAEWAIQQSLQRMRQADDQQKDGGGDDDQEEV